MSYSFNDYAVSVYWHEVYKFFVAEIPEIMFCSGDGATHEEAIAALRANFELMKDVAEEEGKPWPTPFQSGFVTSTELKKASDVLNLSRVASEAGISPQTLHSKLKRNTKLNKDEKKKLSSVLFSSGLILSRANLDYVRDSNSVCFQCASTKEDTKNKKSGRVVRKSKPKPRKKSTKK